MAKATTAEPQTTAQAVSPDEFKRLTQVIKVKLVGMAPLLFNRYVDDRPNPDIPLIEKLYRDGETGTLFFPAENIFSFLGSQKKSCVRAYEKKGEWEKYARAILSAVAIEPVRIPLTRNGKPIVFNGMATGKEYDEASGIREYHHTARVFKNGQMIPIPVVRPGLDLPWELEFILKIFPTTRLLTPDKLYSYFSSGGAEIGLAAFRPRFGRVYPEVWELQKS